MTLKHCGKTTIIRDQRTRTSSLNASAKFSDILLIIRSLVCMT
jgi:hypothetical protein